MKLNTGQHVLQLEFGIRRLKFPWDTYFYSFASLLAQKWHKVT